MNTQPNKTESFVAMVNGDADYAARAAELVTFIDRAWNIHLGGGGLRANSKRKEELSVDFSFPGDTMPLESWKFLISYGPKQWLQDQVADGEKYPTNADSRAGIESAYASLLDGSFRIRTVGDPVTIEARNIARKVVKMIWAANGKAMPNAKNKAALDAYESDVAAKALDRAIVQKAKDNIAFAAQMAKAPKE